MVQDCLARLNIFDHQLQNPLVSAGNKLPLPVRIDLVRFKRISVSDYYGEPSTFRAHENMFFACG